VRRVVSRKRTRGLTTFRAGKTHAPFTLQLASLTVHFFKDLLFYPFFFQSSPRKILALLLRSQIGSRVQTAYPPSKLSCSIYVPPFFPFPPNYFRMRNLVPPPPGIFFLTLYRVTAIPLRSRATIHRLLLTETPFLSYLFSFFVFSSPLHGNHPSSL